MKPEEFIQVGIAKLKMQFPHLTIRTWYDDIIFSHIVEITPQQEFESNDALDQAWIPMSLQFIHDYPYEDITFISTNSSLSRK